MYTLQINVKSLNEINHFKNILIKIQKFNYFNNIKINGIFKTKKKKKIFTILKSPHVYKKSREHFIYSYFNQKMEIKCKNIFQLFDFLIILRKIFSENLIFNIKIIKNKN